jgi:hypothetical protein
MLTRLAARNINIDVNHIHYISDLTPPKTILQDSSTLLDLRCVPTSNFYLGVREDSLQQSGCGVSSQDRNLTEDKIPEEVKEGTKGLRLGFTK